MLDYFNEYQDTPSKAELQDEQFRERYQKDLKNNLIRAGYNSYETIFLLLESLVEEKLIDIDDLAKYIETGEVKWIY